MATVHKPKVIIEYNGKNISEDITPFLLPVTYTDHVKGKADEIELSIEDSDARWRNEWYPEKGDTIKLQIGYENNLVDCGDFTVDEIEMQGPPDTVSIRGMATSIKKSLRTRKSKAHENKTLKDIAQATASALGLTLDDGSKKIGLDKIRLTRSTQNRETDLEYLRRLSEQYGYSFSVRGTKMHFYHLQDLEESEPVQKIDRTELISYSFKDKATKVYKKAKVRYHDPKTNEVISGEHEPESQTDADGGSYSETTSDDTLELRTKAENKTQADQMAKAALHEHNSKAQTGNVTVIGNPLFLAGNNIEITGMGTLSGKFHILQSTHKIDRSGGYTTDLDLKRVAKTVKKSEYKTKPKDVAATPKPRPSINYLQGDLLIFPQNS